MDPFIRQTSLEILLDHSKELTAEELQRALRLGLTDPDLHINQIAWEYVCKNKMIPDFKKEIIEFVHRLKKEGDGFSGNLAKVIEKKL